MKNSSFLLHLFIIAGLLLSSYWITSTFKPKSPLTAALVAVEPTAAPVDDSIYHNLI